MILRPRSYFGWGASGADYANPDSGLVIHYNGAATGLKTQADCVRYWKGVRSSHVNGNGWADLGYSFGVAVNGEVFTGRGLNKYQAAQGTTSGNSNWYSVSLMIGGNEQPTPAQIQGVRDLRAYLMARGVSGAIRGHRDFVSTSCPGTPLYRMVQDGTFGKKGNGTPNTGGGSGEYRPENGDGLFQLYEYGDAIKPLQAKLGVTADGYYGPGTEAAVRAYQKANGLDVDGIAGPATLAHLGLTAPAAKPDSGVRAWPGVYLKDYTAHSSVRTYQQRMRDRGWSIGVDGQYGPASARVTRQFQQEKRLGVDGIVGPDTWAAAWTAPVT
ncbi:N-acetylmuramoyl-L-alanine amidase [Nocardiopsis sp. CT-R113]|uniref:N-acetylmuramoyl-L-alanine amidase n=1 Tax=Nocardiopsis codii TaxID=3065942 RepID=A0ABU7KF00_9ACTN|nr:N-acetylmuramoyl-L-alanine amidase [Nocardiopsis sp. CT-R113]MEE2040167.1 N-acetylmuramoyl-L-alanine amidase [Nocardiopsis sp. CT-R113]